MSSGAGPDLARLTLPGFLREVVARHGSRVALRFPEEGRELRYDELEREARALARALIGAGVVKGARVALLMGNRPEWAVAWLAAGLVGAVLVPVNTFAPPVELDWILRHGDASLLLLQPALGGHRYQEELLARHPEIAAAAPGRIRCPALPQLRRVASLGLAATQRRCRVLGVVPRGGSGSLRGAARLPWPPRSSPRTTRSSSTPRARPSGRRASFTASARR